VTIHAVEGADLLGKLAEFTVFRPSWGSETVPSALYGLCVKQAADWLETKRKEDRVAEMALKTGV
jgi:hypothetical protein